MLAFKFHGLSTTAMPLELVLVVAETDWLGVCVGLKEAESVADVVPMNTSITSS